MQDCSSNNHSSDTSGLSMLRFCSDTAVLQPNPKTVSFLNYITKNNSQNNACLARVIRVILVFMINLKISINDDIFAEIDKRTTADFDHNDVIQKLLKKALVSSQPTIPSQAKPNSCPIPSGQDSIVSFVQTAQYRVLSGIDKYLAVLGWLHKNRPNEFGSIENCRRGNRVYFGQSQRQVEDSGESITAKRIPGCSMWALATLDNRAKRDVLADVLCRFDFQPGEVSVIVDTIQDSGRHRNFRQKTLADYA